MIQVLIRAEEYFVPETLWYYRSFHYLLVDNALRATTSWFLISHHVVSEDKKFDCRSIYQVKANSAVDAWLKPHQAIEIKNLFKMKPRHSYR